MTDYRCVCPVCGAYIRSAEAGCECDEDWQVACQVWLAAHVCGDGKHDGMERSVGEDCEN